MRLLSHCSVGFLCTLGLRVVNERSQDGIFGKRNRGVRAVDAIMEVVFQLLDIVDGVHVGYFLRDIQAVIEFHRKDIRSAFFSQDDA